MLAKIVLILALIVTLSAASSGSGPGRGTPRKWLTGKSFSEALDRPTTVAWADLPLRDALNTLAQSADVAVLLDRRIDPDQALTLDSIDQPLRAIVEKVATNVGCGVSYVDGVIYLGPAEAATRTRTLIALRRQELGKIPPASRKAWLAAAPLAWPDVATPDQILAELSRASGVSYQGMDLIPHDLWAKADLPSLPLVERLSLVLVQFGLTFQIEPDGHRARFVPIPVECVIERRYPGGQSAAALAKEWSGRFINARIRADRNQVVVQATSEDHEQLSQRPTGAKKTNNDPNDLEKVRIDQLALVRLPLDGVVESIGRRLMLEISFDRTTIEQAGIKLDQLITVNVQKATVDEMLKATLEPAGLTFKRIGRKVEIMPAPPK